MIDARLPRAYCFAMSSREFAAEIAQGYAFEEPSVLIGAPLLAGVVSAEARVRAPLSMLNRHGLIAGATGTGKTKTLQVLAEQLSEAGVPVFLADVKGDLSGLAAPGTTDPKVSRRAEEVGVPFAPAARPVEFLSLTGARGIPVRATISSFGPLLLARALGLNETQRAALAICFRYCDDKGLLLLDLSDLRAVLLHLTGPAAEELAPYGGLAKATAGVLLRHVTELEQQGGRSFFGEPELEIEDLLRTDAEGAGVISILELADMQDRPDLYATFLMWLLASLYRDLPEAGDLEKPKLVFFFDEAHLLFDEASKEFREHIEQVVRLIRSKGVGVFFVTHSPRDVPADVLAQLGNRVQHALRAYTPADEKALRAAANTFPRSVHYDIPETLQSLGVGEALVTVLSPRGTPTPVVAALLPPPMSRMGPATPEEVEAIVRASPLRAEYATAIDRESARESLERRELADSGLSELEGKSAPRAGRGPKDGDGEPTLGERLGKALQSPAGKTLQRELVRGLFGVLGLRTTTRRRRRGLL
jgi:DNA helicase HerA-like ATPase